MDNFYPAILMSSLLLVSKVYTSCSHHNFVPGFQLDCACACVWHVAYMASDTPLSNITTKIKV